MKHKLIAFTGKQGSGKTECVNTLKKLYPNAVVIKFAQPIYAVTESLCETLGVTFSKAKHREIMQCIGTTMRREHGSDFWVNQWELAYKHHKFFKDRDALVLVDDARFDNEALKIMELGGKVIAVECEEATRASRIKIVGADHESEKGIDSNLISATVYNNGNTKDLESNLKYLFEVL